MLEMKVVSICLAKIKISTVALENCKISALNRSIEKPVLLDFESLSTIFWLVLFAKTHFLFSLTLEVLELTSLQALAF